PEPYPRRLDPLGGRRCTSPVQAPPGHRSEPSGLPARALGNFLNGAFVAPTGNALVSRNPAADGAVVFETGTSVAAVGDAVAAAAAAQPAWARLTVAERAVTLERFKQAIAARADALAEAIVLETGKLRSEAKAEIQTLINRFDLARGAVTAEATGGAI